MSSLRLECQDLIHQIELFDDALINADYERLRRYVSPGFMMINPLAQCLDKQSWLDWLAKDIRYHRIERDQLSCRVLVGTGIVTSQVRALMAVAGLLNGEPAVHHTFRTEVWAMSPEGLLLEHVHLTRRE